MNAPPEIDWQPTASLERLRLRAEVLRRIREFFAERQVLEVETPLLAAAPVTDLHLSSIDCQLQLGGEPRRLYLQTSPEFAMKRLLAAGVGAIYQMARAFRDGEAGSRHNPEFTLLEWYRPGWDHHRLMAEVDELIRAVLKTPAADKLTYGEAFERYVGIDPHSANSSTLAAAAARLDLQVEGLDAESSKDDWLHLLGSLKVEPELGRSRPTLLYEYPATQAALARIRPGNPPVAERFELYIDGLELANGFHELTDAAEQRQRFESDLEARRQRGLAQPPLDERLLAALKSGMPASAGVALGIDRLVMLAANASSIREVLAFPTDRA